MLVSIILAVKNGAETVEDALKSLLAQSYPCLEIIVIDGGSTDGTLDVLEKYRPHFSYFISEPDSGISDAWNKGITAATGSLIAFLNADDYYATDAVEQAVRAIGTKKRAISYGSTWFGEDDDFELIVGSHPPKNILRHFNFYFTSCFVTKDVYDSVGLFNTSVRIAIDTDFLLRAVLNNVEFVASGVEVYMRRGGVSDRFYLRAYSEYVDALSHHSFIEAKDVKRLKFKEKYRYKAKKVISVRALLKFKDVVYFTLLAACNLGLAILPGFRSRALLLKAIKADIDPSATVHRKQTLIGFGKLSLGENSTINYNCLLDLRRGIKIGRNVTLSQGVQVFTLGHDPHDRFFRLRGARVEIDDDVVIFSKCLIYPGVKIGKGAVVYPGSVVTKDVAEWEIVGGNPAKRISTRQVAGRVSYSAAYNKWLAF